MPSPDKLQNPSLKTAAFFPLGFVDTPQLQLGNYPFFPITAITRGIPSGDHLVWLFSQPVYPACDALKGGKTQPASASGRKSISNQRIEIMVCRGRVRVLIRTCFFLMVLHDTFHGTWCYSMDFNGALWYFMDLMVLNGTYQGCSICSTWDTQQVVLVPVARDQNLVIDTQILITVRMDQLIYILYRTMLYHIIPTIDL